MLPSNHSEKALLSSAITWSRKSNLLMWDTLGIYPVCYYTGLSCFCKHATPGNFLSWNENPQGELHLF